MAVNLGTLRDSLPFNDGKTAVKIRVSSRAKGGTQLLQRILKHISDTSIEVGSYDKKNAYYLHVYQTFLVKKEQLLK